MTLRCKVNGEERALEIKAGELLLDVLRDRLRLTAAKRGCGNGECGACTVLVDGEAVNACLYLAARAQGREILTLEGLGGPESLHPLQRNFREAGALQCGFCGSGMILTAKALLDRNPNPSEAEIREGIAGNLCRCSGYVKIIEAIGKTAAELWEGGDGLG